MKIAVDARELTGKATGVGRYLAELIGRWSEDAHARRHEWRLYAHERPTVPAHFASAVEVVAGAGGTRWEQWSFARALSRTRPDVLFAPGYTAPMTAPCPTVLTVHDVSFAAHPEWFSFSEGLRRRTLTAWSARRARVILTDSAFSRDEIVRCLGIPVQKVRLVPLGITRNARQAPVGGPSIRTEPHDSAEPHGGATSSGRLEVPNGREPVVLFVGSIFRRRNVDRLISTFADSVARRVPNSRLEIVGEDRTYPPLDLQALLAQLPADVRRRVTVRSYVDGETLRELYQRAMVFAFLSEYEGFGLTPLEAIAARVPPVVLDTAIAREIYGPAARYVLPNLSNPAPLADALVDLLTNESSRDLILAHADAVLSRYDWSLTAAATLAALEDAASA